MDGNEFKEKMNTTQSSSLGIVFGLKKERESFHIGV